MPRPSEEPSRRSANLRSRTVRTKRRQTLVPLVIAVLGFSVWLAFSGFQIQFQNNIPSDSGTCVAHPVILDDSTTVLAGLSDSFNFSDPIVHEYAGLVNRYLAPWAPIPGVARGYGKRGMINDYMLKHVSLLWMFMSCCGHVRIIKGKIYYRYGGFYTVWYRLIRFNQSLKMMEAAIQKYNLQHLSMEMFINTCDHPMSFYSAHWFGRGGFPVMSTGFTADVMDIGIPDALDLTEGYTPDLALQSGWEEKEARAVFRGATTSYELKNGNWGPNPRVRLHRLSDVYPELLDTRVNRWSHALPPAQEGMKRDSVELAEHMNFTVFNRFKYQVVVDGGGGSCRTCGVLRSNQLVIRQATPMLQFHEPLLQDKVHMLAVDRVFNDLPEKVRWAREHDAEVVQMVGRANEVATHTCTFSGRTLYWGILLSKYAAAMTDPDSIKAPTNICAGSLILKSPENMAAPSVMCTDPKVDEQQHPCTFFCVSSPMNGSKLVWMDRLDGIEPLGPP